jgi:hypothetical protein
MPTTIIQAPPGFSDLATALVLQYTTILKIGVKMPQRSLFAQPDYYSTISILVIKDFRN